MPQAKLTNHDATSQMAQRVAAALELRLLQHSASEDGEKRPLTPFDSATIPPVSMSAYLARLARFCRCGEECFVVALVYLDMVTQGKALTPLSMRNAHRLFLTCLLMAHKFWDDSLPWNSHYAKCGGITLQEMNRLEIFFLKTVGFRLQICRHTYAAYEAAVTAIERLQLEDRSNVSESSVQLKTQPEAPTIPSDPVPAISSQPSKQESTRAPDPPQPAQKRQCLQRGLVPTPKPHVEQGFETTKEVELSRGAPDPVQQGSAQKCLHLHHDLAEAPRMRSRRNRQSGIVVRVRDSRSPEVLIQLYHSEGQRVPSARGKSQQKSM